MGLGQKHWGPGERRRRERSGDSCRKGEQGEWTTQRRQRRWAKGQKGSERMHAEWLRKLARSSHTLLPCLPSSPAHGTPFATGPFWRESSRQDPSLPDDIGMSPQSKHCLAHHTRNCPARDPQKRQPLFSGPR